jgi:hypothetical protein
MTHLNLKVQNCLDDVVRASDGLNRNIKALFDAYDDQETPPDGLVAKWNAVADARDQLTQEILGLAKLVQDENSETFWIGFVLGLKQAALATLLTAAPEKETEKEGNARGVPCASSDQIY